MHGFKLFLWLIIPVEDKIFGKPAGGIVIELTRR